MDDAPATPLPTKPARRGLPPSSIFLLTLSGVLGVLSVLLATGKIGGSTPEAPPPTPGQASVIDVVNALRAQGMAAELARDIRSVRGDLSQPGQGLLVDGQPVYVFVFGAPADAEEAFGAVDPGRVLPQEAAPAGTPFVAQGSNVVVAVPDGDEAFRQRVETAVEGLP